MAHSIDALSEIERRVLWLATYMIHHANRIRSNPSGVKVGGHQASSSSVVTIMTELFFDFMRRGDRLSVKPHASPVLHAIQYLLGQLDRSYLTRLREFHGLQAYPSRTKDPDPVDFSTGSVGLGSVAPNFAALVDQFIQTRFERRAGAQRRFLSLLGDAELDEGSVWEAIAEPALAGLRNVIWIVDLNRQSLDRVVPGIRVRQLEAMFRANDWYVVEAKYGTRLRKAFAGTRGDLLQRTIDEMSNEHYQYLLRAPAREIAQALGEAAPDGTEADLRSLISDLGGHDFKVLREALAAANDRGPAVVFAYTIKGWGLPIAGDPLNHSALLSAAEIEQLRNQLGVPVDDPWAQLPKGSVGAKHASGRQAVLYPADAPAMQVVATPDVPKGLGMTYRGTSSTQRSFGQILMELSRTATNVAERIVTASPDVATSTNLGGWINKVGVWGMVEGADRFKELGPRLIEWRRSPQGRHIELGISETNLVLLLGQLGLARETTGEPLFPIGTMYDPFLARALDAYIYGIYSGARSILVGTPSGVTLAPEGGAHQSVVTPNIVLAVPGLTCWEPCFAQELEWALLEALAGLHRELQPESAYFRLTTAPVDQGLMPTWPDREAQRRAVLSGAWRVVDRRGEPGANRGQRVDIWASGVMVAEAIRAAQELRHDEIYASVVSCVSPGRVYREWQGTIHSAVRVSKAAPVASADAVVTVLDGHPSALAWVGSMLGVPSVPLGVTRFGESGTIDDLYTACAIDWKSIYSAAYVALRQKEDGGLDARGP